MKKIIMVLIIGLSLGGCSTLKKINEQDKTARKELKIEQKEELKLLKEQQKLERELLVKKQALKLAAVGGVEYIKLKTSIEKIIKELDKITNQIK